MNEKNLMLNDFTTKILIDARGEKIKVFRYTLMKSTYFQLMCLGNSKDNLQNDGSYFVDCDGDIFRELVALMETGMFRTSRFSTNYMKCMCDKFGIDYEPPRKITKDEECKLLIKKRRTKQKQKLFDVVQSHIKKGNYQFIVQFLPGDGTIEVINEDKIISCFELVVSNFINNLLDSPELRILFFKPAIPEGYKAEYTSINKMRTKELHFNIQPL